MSGSGPHGFFFRGGGGRNFIAIRSRIHKNTDYFRGWPGVGHKMFRALCVLSQSLIVSTPLPLPPVEKSCICASSYQQFMSDSSRANIRNSTK